MPGHFANICMFDDRDFMLKVGKCPTILQTKVLWVCCVKCYIAYVFVLSL